MHTPSPQRQAFGFAALIAALGVLGVAVLALQFDGRIEAPHGRPRRDHTPLVPPRVADFPSSTEALREMLSARLRLRPDARALAALAELRRMRGLAPLPTEARWTEGRWRIHAGAQPLGDLDAHADFDALLSLIVQAAAGLPPLPLTEGPAPEAAAWPSFTMARPTVATLSALDVAWRGGSRSPEVLRAAARALVALAVETPDRVGAADPLAARALAALAWARAAGVAEPEAEATLARAMGYDEAASRRAATLPETSPARLWIARDDARLAALAARDGGGAASYLWFRRLVERGDRTRALAWHDAQPEAVRRSVAVSSFTLDAYGRAPIEVYRPLVAEAPATVLRALAAEAGVSLDAAPPALLPRLAWLTGRLRGPGPFYDLGAATARADAAVLSAVVDDLTFRRDVWAAHDAAVALAEGLGDVAPGRYADFAGWAHTLASASPGAEVANELREGLDARGDVGAPLRIQLYDVLTSSFGGMEANRAALEALVRHLDGRPATLGFMAGEVRTELADLPRSEALCEALLAVSRRTPERAVAYCLDARGDVAGLLAIARDDTRSPDDRDLAIRFAAEGRVVDEAAVLDAWATLDASDPESPPTSRAAWLRARGRAPDATSLLRAWLQHHSDAPGVAAIRARASLAQTLREQGDAASSWALVEGDLASMVGPSLREGALALATLHRDEEAEQVARRCLDRYGDAVSLATLAEVLWLRGQPRRAADALRSAEGLRDDLWRGAIGEAFARVHRRAPVEAAREAFAPLTTMRLPPQSLRRMVAALGAAGRWDLTVALYGMIHHQEEPLPPAGALFFQVQEYKHRTQADGHAAALAWLRERVVPAHRPMLSLAAFAFDDTELLWDLVEPGGTPDQIASVWLFRQADALRAAPTPARRAAFDAWYASGPSSDYATMARYLRGDVAQPALHRIAANERRRTEVAYYLALRAKAEGRVADATDWFTFAVLAGTLRDGEHSWSQTALRAWRDRDEPVSSLAAHPWEAPAPSAGAPATAPPPAATEETAPRRHRRRHEGGRSRRHRRH